MSLLPQTLLNLFASKKYTTRTGEERPLDDNISQAEAEAIVKAMQSVQAKTTVETGVASGVSALAICNALRSINKENQSFKHYGVDPNQISYYGGAALKHLEEEGLLQHFNLLEGPSHTMLPLLIEKKEEIDFALIDGWHTFDYTLVDFFFIDKLLKEGGIIAFHDCYSSAKQKVLKYIETHRKYEYADEFAVRGNESFKTTMKFFVWRMWQNPKLIFSKFNWKYLRRNTSGLFIIRKVKTYEPNFDFYKSF
jgi:predicted O-methyltransferase YrrM